MKQSWRTVSKVYGGEGRVWLGDGQAGNALEGGPVSCIKQFRPHPEGPGVTLSFYFQLKFLLR